MDDSLRTRAEQLASEMASQARTAEDLNGLMRLMMKSALERMLNSELDVHLGRKALAPGGAALAVPSNGSEPPPAIAATKHGKPNRRNGRSQKTVQGDLGELTIATPRDRDGTFEPQLIGKHQRRVPGFDEKILALYAKGMTTRDIQEIVRELYDVEVSATLVSEITADLDAEVTAWRTRPLSEVWPIVYFDGIVVHVRGANGRVSLALRGRQIQPFLDPAQKFNALTGTGESRRLKPFDGDRPRDHAGHENQRRHQDDFPVFHHASPVVSVAASTVFSNATSIATEFLSAPISKKDHATASSMIATHGPTVRQSAPLHNVQGSTRNAGVKHAMMRFSKA